MGKVKSNKAATRVKEYQRLERSDQWEKEIELKSTLNNSSF